MEGCLLPENNKKAAILSLKKNDGFNNYKNR